MSDTLHGYHGHYLYVDLSTRQSIVRELPVDVLRAFIGGSGLGTWLLREHTPDSIDPLATEAPLLFVFSPLVGSPLTTSAKFAVMAKSPLTQRINDSLSSSTFAIAGTRTGHDAIVVTGRSDSPTCLVIEPESVRFAPADDVWGLSSRQASDDLRQRLGRQFHVAAIGPAGENLVR